jgi:hypothetical protein
MRNVLSALLLIIMIACAVWLINAGASWAVAIILLFGGWMWVK